LKDTIPNPRVPGSWVSLFEISKPQNNYMVLESYIQDGSEDNSVSW